MCHAQINTGLERRLYWTVIPSGCVLGNSVSYLDFPRQVLESLGEKFGTTEEALNAIVNQLNSEEIDLWAKAWAANNVNNYEIETLPFPPLNGATTFLLWEKKGEYNLILTGVFSMFRNIVQKTNELILIPSWG